MLAPLKIALRASLSVTPPAAEITTSYLERMRLMCLYGITLPWVFSSSLPRWRTTTWGVFFKGNNTFNGSWTPSISIIETMLWRLQVSMKRLSVSVGEFPKTVAAVAPASQAIITSSTAPSTVFKSATICPGQRLRISKMPCMPSRLR